MMNEQSINDPLGVPVPIADNTRTNSLGHRPVQDIQGGEINTNYDFKT